MHILYIINDVSYFRAHRERLAQDALDHDHRVTVATGFDLEDDLLTGWNDALALVKLPLDKHKLNPLRDVKLLWRLYRLINSQRPDVVHCFTIKPILFGGLAALTNRLTGFRTGLVWTFAGLGKIYNKQLSLLERFRRFTVEQGLKATSQFLPVRTTFENEADRQELIARGITTSDMSQTIMGTGIDFDIFTNEGKVPVGPAGPLRFLLAARLIKSKGVQTYIEVAAKAKTEGLNAVFTLAGLTDFDHPDAIGRDEIVRAQDDGSIQYLENVSQELMPELLRKTDVFCLPTSYNEGVPRALLEAAACGAALISTEQAGMQEILVPDQSGWFVRPMDPEDLYKTVKRAIDNREQAEQMGRQARQILEKLPASSEAVWNTFENIYSSFDSQV